MTEVLTANQSFLSEHAVFALDIGTRSIIGMVGIKEEDKINIIAVEQAEHTRRAMIDGQIEDIEKVSRVAGQVKKKLEERLDIQLDRVCVAAAGRALKTQRASYEMELSEVQLIDEELISQLEAGAIGMAEETFDSGAGDEGAKRRFYLVGYTVTQYYLDNYMMSSLKDHRGKKIQVDIIATFLPSEVVESLYTAMKKIGLEVASLTLEPIAAINAAIPENLRLLNLVLVDIGAGTSDIAACRDGSVIGYTMATVAGDEVTEALMKEYLVDFQTAEWIKAELKEKEEIQFTDILGIGQTVSRDQVMKSIEDTSERLCKEISEKILEVNGGKPSAVFLAGGGSKLSGLRDGVVQHLGMDPQRVAIAGNNFQINAYSDTYDLNNPEYATPLGIVISAGLNLINDSFFVTLNGKQAKLFRSGTFTIRDILMMNGYGYQDMIGRTGQSLIVTVNGRRTAFYGSQPEPAQLKVNEKEGKLSDIVHAGDNIVFIPARHGKAAQARLGDILGIEDGLEIMLNGADASMDTELKNGDIISYLKKRDVSEMEDAPEPKHEPDRGTQYGSGGQGTPAQPEQGGQPVPMAQSAQADQRVPEVQSAPGAQRVPEVPSASGIQRVPEVPSASGIQRVQEVSSVPGIQRVQEVSSVSGIQRVQEVPSVPGTQRVPESQSASGGQRVPEVPSMPGVQRVSDIQSAPEVQRVTGAQSAQGVQRMSKVQSVSGPQPVQAAQDVQLSQTLTGAQPPQPAQPSQVVQYAQPASPAQPGRPPQSYQSVRAGMETAAARIPSPSAPAGNQNTAIYGAGTSAQGSAGIGLGREPSSGGYSPWNNNSSNFGSPSVPSQPAVPGGLMVTLNDKPLSLPPKNGGNPYYLMDMLEHSGIDFDHIKGQVILEVNGKPGNFQQKLRNGDMLSIYEKC